MQDWMLDDDHAWCFNSVQEGCYKLACWRHAFNKPLVTSYPDIATWGMFKGTPECLLYSTTKEKEKEE